MKYLAAYAATAIMLCTGYTANAQTAEAHTENPNMLAEAKLPAVEQAKEITITLKNDCTSHINIFAGSKKEVFDGKSQPVGGHSVNTLYIKEGDVVCIMNSPKVIQACAIAKPGVTNIEINPSGNGFIK